MTSSQVVDMTTSNLGDVQVSRSDDVASPVDVKASENVMPMISCVTKARPIAVVRPQPFTARADNDQQTTAVEAMPITIAATAVHNVLMADWSLVARC